MIYTLDVKEIEGKFQNIYVSFLEGGWGCTPASGYEKGNTWPRRIGFISFIMFHYYYNYYHMQ